MASGFLAGSSYAARLANQYQQQFGRPASADDPAYAAYVQTALPQLVQSDRDAIQRSKSRWGIADKIATGAAGALLTGGLSSIFTAPAAASSATSAGWSMPGVTAPTFGAQAATTIPKLALAAPSTLTKMGSILSNPGTQLAVNSGLSLYALHSQNKANSQARADAIAARNQEIELQLKQIAEASRNADLDREDARRLNEQAHALQEEQLTLQKEAAASQREVFQYQRDRDARDDARLAPYRAIGERAARRLSSIWGL